MKRIALLGSTGSIGKQTLEVVRDNRDKFCITALAVHSNIDLLARQIAEFRPKLVVITDKQAAKRFKADYTVDCEVLVGEEHLCDLATMNEVDVLLTAVVGFVGLKPTLAAIKAGKDIALANKETLVAAGKLVMEAAAKYNSAILPVDSEHSAVLQSMVGQDINKIQRIILTASGGPFRGKGIDELKNVSLADCLKHPNWNMGRKITVDSASLANKGLEVIEARWLFDVPLTKIDVVVHPQSIIHSMVEYQDGAVMAQLGIPDMKLPILYALTYPKRVSAEFGRLDFLKHNNLTFEAPDTAAFPCLRLAYQAGSVDGTLSCAFNAANEVAVQALFDGKIKFMDIPVVIEHVLSKQDNITEYTLEDIFMVDKLSRAMADEYMVNAR